MAETHELRLKINAAAARAGSREFVGAIANIKRAVTELDRLSDGTFKRLSKNAQDAGKAAKVKINPVDRTAIRNLDEFAKIQAQVIRQTANSRQGLAGLMDGLRNVSGAYVTARGNSDTYTTSLIRTNTALTRQAQLLTQVAAASRRAGSQASVQSTSPVAASDRAAQNQVAMQNRVQRAVDDTRLSVERLVTQLMKLGGFQQINQVTRAFRDFQREVSKSSLSTTELDAAKTRLNTSIRNAQTAVVTLTAKEQENARATREAAAAARQHEEAVRRNQAAAREAATATKQHATETERQQALSLSSAAAMRRAAEETARLSERLRRVGDTKGLAAINAALNQFRSSVGAGVTSSTQLRTAVSQFGEAASRAKIGLTQMEGSQRRAAETARQLAAQERDAATQARRVEREMRSIAGASSAASRAFREATGSMRGMENAFSATFQIGSAFRTMLGSITFGTFTQSVYRAGSALEQFGVTMQVATGSVAGAASEIDFIDGLARRLGTNLRGAREDFAKFAVSANLAGVETDTTRDIFESVAMAMSVMGRGAEDQRLAFLALEQMLSKNVVSSEELRRQLGERLPGAVNLMARAVGVSTAELQDMLKAGELVSSEVLPAFAREVRAAFGPGLEAATRRASFNLGTLQVEFEKLLETVANAGFMDGLASGFRELTAQLQQPEVQATVEKLGAGLADLTGIVLNFASTFVDNLETISKVAKAVITGVLVRQAVLLGNALITQGQRAAIGFSTLVGAITSSTAATTTNTTVTTANTAARRLNTTQLAAAAAGLSSFTAAQAANTAAAAASTGVLGRMAAGLSATGVAAGRLAAGLGIATRVLGGLAGPIGLAVTALTLIPMAFGDIGSDADNMADQIESAIRRAGVSFESLERSAARASSAVELNRIITDIETLGDAVETFASRNTIELFQLRELIAAIDLGDLQNLLGHNAQGRFGGTFGEASRDIGTFGDETQRVIRDLSAATVQAVETGEGFLVLRDNIAAAMVENPSASPILRTLAELTEQLALSELALVANRERLVELYGTADDRLVKSFADSAQAVIRTGTGLDELQRRLNSMAGDAPQVRQELEQVFSAVEDALASGQSESSFRAQMLQIFGGAAEEVERLRAEVAAAQDEAGRAGVAFAEAFTANMDELGQRRLTGRLMDPNTVTELELINAELQRFRDFSVGIDQVQSAFGDFDFPTAEAEAFGQAVLAQFRALPEGAQTYAELSRILESVGEDYPIAATQAFEESLRRAVRAGQENSYSIEEFVDRLEELRDSYPNGAAREYLTNIINAANAQSDAEAAARAALLTQREQTAAMREAAAGANEQASALLNLTGAFDAVRAAAEGMDARLGSALAATQERLELSQLEGADAAVARYFASFGEGGKIVAEARAEIAALREQATTAIRDGGLSPGDGPAQGLMAEVEAREVALQRFIDQQTRLQRALYEAGRSNNQPTAIENTIASVTQQLPRYSQATQRVVEDTLAMFRAAQNSGTGFVELRSHLERTISNSPSAAPLLEQLDRIIAESARAEAQINEQRLSTQNLFGASYDDQVVASFAALGEDVITGSEGMDTLRERMRELGEQAPGTAERLQAIFNEVDASMRANEGVDIFRTRIVDMVDQSGAALERLRREAALTQQAADNAAASFANSFTEVFGQLQNLSVTPDGGPTISQEQIQILAALTAEYQRFQETAISVADIQAAFDTLSFPTARAQEFGQALLEQFAALPAGEQTYTNFTNILTRLGQEYPTVESSTFVQQLREVVSGGSDATQSASDYIRSLETLRDSMPTSELRDLIQALIEDAQAKNQAETASYSAATAFNTAGNAAAQAGAQAAGAANGFYALASAAATAFATIASAQANIGAALTSATQRVNDQLRIEGLGERDAFIERSILPTLNTINTELERANAELARLGPDHPAAEGVRDRIRSLETEARGVSTLRTRYGELFDLRLANRPTSGSGGGGGGSAADALTEEQQALEALIEGVDSHTQSLAAQSAAYALLINRTTSSETAARLLGEAMAAGVELTDAQTQAIIEQAEAAEYLNEKLEILANDPVNAWMDSVPSWIEAGQQIEENAIRAVSDSFKELLKTGEFSMAALAQTIIGAAIDIVADKAVKGLIGLLGGNISGEGVGGFGLGSILGGVFGGVDESGPDSVFGGGGGEAAAIQAAFTAGGQQAAAMIQQALVSGGQQIGVGAQQGMMQGGLQAQQQIQMGHQLGGTQAGIRVRTAHSAGGAQVGVRTRLAHTQGSMSLRQGVMQGSEVGGSIIAGKMQAAAAGSMGGGGLGIGGIFTSLLGLFFEEGGLTSDPTPVNTPTMLPADMFKGVPHFAEGTANTSGIPAILHDNEAVVPLSKGRKIPVEMDEKRGQNPTIINQTIHIETPNVREFNNSRSQIGEKMRRMASQGQRIS